MDDIIKSAREIAMERIEKLGETTEEERLGWKYSPEGEKLAAKYLNNGLDLLTEVAKYDDEAKIYVLRSASKVLVRNIDMPRNDVIKNNSQRAMDGIQLLKTDKVAVDNVFSKINFLFNHYEEQGQEQRQQAYQSLKADMGAKIQQALQQQTGQMMDADVDVETQPQFQQEWRKILNQMDNAYLGHLNDHKRELLGID